MKKRQAQLQKLMEELLPENLDTLLKETLESAIGSAKDGSRNVRADPDKLKAAGRDALESLDRDKLERWARDSIRNLDADKLEQWARNSLRAVDADKMRRLLRDRLGGMNREQLDALLKEGMRHIDRRKLEDRLRQRIRSLDLEKIKATAAAGLADLDLSSVERFVNDRVDNVVRARLDTLSAEELELLAANKRAAEKATRGRPGKGKDKAKGKTKGVVLVEEKDRSNPVTSLVGTMGRFALLGAAGWVAYSHLFLEHQIPLPKAIAAELLTLVYRPAGPINIYQDRTGSGRPLVLIHSINAAASSYEMRPLFQHYRGKRPVFALDLPGFGFSARNNIEYAPDIYVNAIITMLAGLNIESADVVALSLSSEFAAEAARRRPELFNSLTLISPSGMMARGGSNSSQMASALGVESLALPLLSFRLWARPFYDLLTTRRSLEWFLQKSFVGPIPDGMLNYSYSTSHQPGAEHAPLYFVAGKLFTPSAFDTIYRHVNTPTLVLYDRDAYVSFDRLPELLATNKAWQATRISPTLGLPHWEKPEATMDALEAFWESVQEREREPAPA